MLVLLSPCDVVFLVINFSYVMCKWFVSYAGTTLVTHATASTVRADSRHDCIILFPYAPNHFPSCCSITSPILKYTLKLASLGTRPSKKEGLVNGAGWKCTLRNVRKLLNLAESVEFSTEVRLHTGCSVHIHSSRFTRPSFSIFSRVWL